MKKLFSLYIALTMTFTAFADRPYFVGHRGSYWAVENTKEAFELGCTRGDFDYLECDVKVTKDKKFVISHDDDVSRFNSSSKVTISGTNLADLQKIKLSQTRGGKSYTGYLCSLDEYLDICKKYGKRPVIELKWADGINSNSQSNIPALVKAIEAKGFRNTCVILTSMKPCLQYLHDKYPDIKLQFLTGEYWESHFDWCVARGIDVDIQVGSWLTKAVVDKYHKAGLKVNIWTVNSVANYNTYKAMGVDYITTDYLEPDDITSGATDWETKPFPETESGTTNPGTGTPTPDPDPILPTEDYVDVLAGSTVTPAASYAFRSEYVDYAIAELTGKTIRRVIARNNLLYILAVDAKKAPTVLVFNPTTKAVTNVSIKGMATTATGDWAYACSDIGVTACGHLIAGNLASVVHANTDEVVSFWKWENDANGLPTGDPIDWIDAHAAGNWGTGYGGETFAYTGNLQNGVLYYSGESATATAHTTRIVLLPIIDGSVRKFSSTVWYHAKPQIGGADITAAQLGADFRFTLSPNKDNIIITGSSNTYTLGEYKYAYEASSNAQAINTHNELPASLGISSAVTHVGFFKYAGAAYVATPSADGVRLLDVTNGISKATLVQTTGTTLSDVSGVNAAVGQVVATKDGAGNITRGDIDLFLLRGDKLTFLTTRAEEGTTPNPDPEPDPEPDPTPDPAPETTDEDYADVLESSTIVPESSYDFRSEYVDYAIAELAGKTVRRVIARSNLIYILAVDANKAPTILVFNSKTKAVTKVATEGMKTTATGEWAYPCSDIAVTWCGHLIASNIAPVTYGSTASVVTFYKWEQDAAGLPTGNPTAWIQAPAAGNWSSGLGGETFCYTGNLQNGMLYLSGENANGTANPPYRTRLVVVPVVNGVPQSFANNVSKWFHAKFLISDTEITAADLGVDFRFTLSPTKDNIVITGSTDTYTLGEYAYIYDATTLTQTLNSHNDIPELLGISKAITHVGFFRYAGATYCATPSADGVRLLDVTDGIGNATLVQTTGTMLSEVAGVNAAVGHVVATKDEQGTVTRGDIDLFLLRGDKATLLTTRAKQGTMTAFENVIDENAPVTYYTLTGIEVPADKLSAGVYIRKQGNTATKVMIR